MNRLPLSDGDDGDGGAGEQRQQQRRVRPPLHTTVTTFRVVMVPSSTWVDMSLYVKICLDMCRYMYIRVDMFRYVLICVDVEYKIMCRYV